MGLAAFVFRKNVKLFYVEKTFDGHRIGELSLNYDSNNEDVLRLFLRKSTEGGDRVTFDIICN